MATEIKFRRGTTEEHSFFTGAVGEITIDTTKNTVVVHDGKTKGGFPLVNEAQIEKLTKEIQEIVGKVGDGYTPPSNGDGGNGGDNGDNGDGQIDPPEPGTLLVNVELKSYTETLKVINNAKGVINIDFAEANVFQVNMSGDTEINIVKNRVPAGKAAAISLVMQQPSTAKAVVWDSSIKWPKNEAPVLPTGGKTYVFTLLTTNGGQTWIGLMVGEEIDA